MIGQNIILVATRSLFIDFLGDLLYFPLWWYSVGLREIALTRWRNIGDTTDHLALRLLVLNIFKPMFAQYDRAGRIISFFMRIIILIGRLIYLVVYSILELAILLVWIGLPIFIFWRLSSIL